MSTESTPLTADPQFRPSYVFPGVNPIRSRKKQIRQVQCCICAFFLGVLALALVVTISYSIMGDPFPNITAPLDYDYGETKTVVAPLVLEPDPNIGLPSDNFLLAIQKPLDDEPPMEWSLPNIAPDMLIEAENIGARALGDKEIFDENLAVVPINSPSYRHQKAITASIEGRKRTNKGFIEVRATIHLATIYNYSKPQGIRMTIGNGPKVDLTQEKEKIKCNFNSRYRKADGSCNNKAHPHKFGAAMNPFRRAMNPDYGDGINSPRQARHGGSLPTARTVSLQIHRPSYSSDPYFTVMLAVWGQFLDHDISATAASTGPNGESIDCCSQGGKDYSECFAVPIGPGDPFFDNYNLTCMNFIRSAPASTGIFGPRQQLNQATSFIDGSVVYGNTEEKHRELRAGKNGMLRMFVTPDNRTLLPISADPKDGCNRAVMMEQGKYCFDSGDTRSNENLHLTSMHLIWARHHNYLAKNLQEINPEWNDETVFQEARKIVAAQMQHITYNEFLPILIGREMADAKGLLPNISRTHDTYDADVNPQIANNFAGAAFRFAHTLLPGLMKMTKNDSSPEGIELHRMLFNPYSLWGEGGVDRAIESAVQTEISKSDRFFTPELTQKLFLDDSNKLSFKTCGLDLVSLNIQRGRDHGLPPYYEWRRYCGLLPTDTWEKMAVAIAEDSLESMKKIYMDAKDVDLYTGALSELPLEGAIFGPLLTCLITDQFVRLKIGDSHWYERTVGSQRFTKAQLMEIHKTTLAGIICRNTDNLNKSRKYVMEKSDNITNTHVNCTELMDFNFHPWIAKKISNKYQAKVKTSSSQSLISVIKNENNNISERKKL